MKKLSALILVLLVALSCCVCASAATVTDTDHIYLRVPSEPDVRWSNFGMVYCHIWSKSGGEIYGWQSREEQCEDIGDGYWSYDISGIDFDPAGEYSLIFSNNNGMQTYDLNFTSACRGDIVVCQGDTTVNPVDGEKTCAVARWLHNGDRVHPAIQVDSQGTTVNVDSADPDDIDTVWGDSAGDSYELESLVDDTAITEDSDDVVLLIATEPANTDGINTNAASMWIIIACSVVGIAIVVTVVYLARKNRK